MSRPHAWEQQYPPDIDWGAPIAQYTMPELLDRAVAQHAVRPAIEFRGRTTSYAELGARVDAAASRLQALGVGPGVSVAVYLPNTPWHPISFFGILRAGGRVVHLSPLDPPRVLAKKMADADATILIATNLPPLFDAALALLQMGAATLLIVGDDDTWGASGIAAGVPDDASIICWTDTPAPPGAAFPTPHVDDVAVLQYTGGTTGFPKAAMLTHGNLSAAVSIYTAWNHKTFQRLTPDDRVIGVLPLFHIYALTVVLLRSIDAGSMIMLRPRFDPAQTLDDIEIRRATAFPGVPTMWIALVNTPGIEARDLSSLRFVASGGAPMPLEMRQRFNKLTGLRLGGGWGMTETSPAGSGLDASREYPPGAIGVPLPAIEMDVVALDDPARILPPGEIGELRVRGPNVFRGYWKRPQETAAAFVDGWFLTGDMGYMDAAGDFFIVDRKKDMILSGGFNVYPRVIEEAVYEHPDIAECVVIGIPDAYRGQAAKVFAVLRPGAPPLTFEALKAFLGERVGKHEMPVALELRAELPKTNVGKLSRKELVDEELARQAAVPETAA
jgi:long-chain acyl-CoA synthetase